MFENLQKSISRFIQVEPSEFDFFTSCMSFRSFKKKEILYLPHKIPTVAVNPLALYPRISS